MIGQDQDEFGKLYILWHLLVLNLVLLYSGVKLDEVNLAIGLVGFIFGLNGV